MRGRELGNGISTPLLPGYRACCGVPKGSTLSCSPPHIRSTTRAPADTWRPQLSFLSLPHPYNTGTHPQGCQLTPSCHPSNLSPFLDHGSRAPATLLLPRPLRITPHTADRFRSSKSDHPANLILLEAPFSGSLSGDPQRPASAPLPTHPLGVPCTRLGVLHLCAICLADPCLARGGGKEERVGFLVLRSPPDLSLKARFLPLSIPLLDQNYTYPSPLPQGTPFPSPR